MPNRMLTIDELKDQLWELTKKYMGETVEEQRAFFYDAQTSFGRFPYSAEERKRYIETGTP